MSHPISDLAHLDRLIHDPARLAILTALSVCDAADFQSLRQLTGLTKGNLSSHLSKLEAAELVVIEKRFVGKKPNTMVRLADEGRGAIGHHWQRLDELRQRAEGMEKEADSGGLLAPQPEPA
ncbi:MAG: transcriptional regulator [Acidobacteriota bacterium]